MPLLQPHLGQIWALKLSSTITIAHHPLTRKKPNIWIEALPNQAKQVNMLYMVDNLDAVDKMDVIHMVGNNGLINRDCACELPLP